MSAEKDRIAKIKKDFFIKPDGRKHIISKEIEIIHIEDVYYCYIVLQGVDDHSLVISDDCLFRDKIPLMCVQEEDLEKTIKAFRIMDYLVSLEGLSK